MKKVFSKIFVRISSLWHRLYLFKADFARITDIPSYRGAPLLKRLYQSLIRISLMEILLPKPSLYQPKLRKINEIDDQRKSSTTGNHYAAKCITKDNINPTWIHRDSDSFWKIPFCTAIKFFSWKILLVTSECRAIWINFSEWSKYGLFTVSVSMCVNFI